MESAENIEEQAEDEKVEGAGLFEPTVEAEPDDEPGEADEDAEDDEQADDDEQAAADDEPAAEEPAEAIGPAPARDEASRAQQARPEFERVTEVLGPLEQIVLAADQQIGSLQERVDSESSEVSRRIQSRVRDAALEQRGRVLQMKQELTGAASQLATRFETMLDILDQAERQLARQAGESEPAAMRVTVTERQRVTFSHDVSEPGPAPSKGPPPVAESTFTPEPEPEKKRGIRGWFRRRKGSEA